MHLASFVNQFILLGSQRPFRSSFGSYGDNPSRTNPDAITITQTETSRNFACTAEALAIATPDISSATAFAIIVGILRNPTLRSKADNSKFCSTGSLSYHMHNGSNHLLQRLEAMW